MKVHVPSLFLSLIALASCGASASSSSSVSTEYDLESLQSEYGEFSITPAVSGVGSVAYEEETNTYVLSVASTKAEYIVTGYFEGAIAIQNASGLSAYKGVTLTLTKACLVSSGDYAAVDYQLESKNVEIKAKKDTKNLILSRSSGVAVHSENNIEFSGKGDLELASLTEGIHTVRASGDISIYSAPSIVVTTSGHDAFHGNHLYFTDGSEAYSGTMRIHNVVSQAFDFETSSGNGSVSVDGGVVYVDSADAVFKTDKTLTIAKGAKVIATNVRESPYVVGDNSSGLSVDFLGTFTVNGETITE